MPPKEPCPHYPQCVGCALIGQPYGAQLENKRRIVQTAFRRYPVLATLTVPEVVGSPRAFGYRNQAKLVARWSHPRKELLLGIYRPGTHRVVDVRRCPVHHPLIEEIVEGLAAALDRCRMSIYDERTGEGLLRFVIVRVSTWMKRAQLILVTRERAVPQIRGLARALRRVRGLSSIVQNVNPDPGNVIFGPTFVPLRGEIELVERVGFLKLRSTAGAFLQPNIAVARKVYERVLEWAAPARNHTAVDLYCGAGATSFYLATVAQHVAGIDFSSRAIIDAKTNTRLNGFHNVRFYAGETAKVLPTVAGRLARIDLVSLNPPRKGADEHTRQLITACTPRRIVYVSCDPMTLGRDLDWFSSHGYPTTRIQPYDMLPQTEHVECVALLEPA